MQQNTQAGSITANIKVNTDFTLPALSETKIVTWNFHADDSAKVRYDMILGKYLITYLGFNLELSDHVIEADYGYFKGYTTPIIDMAMYQFKALNTGKITTE